MYIYMSEVTIFNYIRIEMRIADISIENSASTHVLLHPYNTKQRIIIKIMNDSNGWYIYKPHHRLFTPHSTPTHT